jgi:putative membrane protein
MKAAVHRDGGRCATALAAGFVSGSTAACMMRILTTIGLLAGLAAVTAMVAWQGFGTIGAALISLGAGLLLLPLAFLPHLVFAAWSWGLLFKPDRAPGFAETLRAMWMGLSVDMLLPLASLGGEVVKVRILMQAGARGADAGASVVVDKTVQAISLILWGLIGIAILVGIEADRELVAGALVASALLAAGVGGFIFVQHAGTFGFLAKLFGKARQAGASGSMMGGAVNLDNTIRALYRHPGRILLATAVRLASRVALTAEVWLAAHLMGFPITLWEALMLKSLTGALRGAAFVVPGGWGVQEGGYVVLGGLLGLSPEVMLAVSLATRARELLVSLPGLVAWQHGEGRSLWKSATSDDRR